MALAFMLQNDVTNGDVLEALMGWRFNLANRPTSSFEHAVWIYPTLRNIDFVTLQEGTLHSDTTGSPLL